MDKVMESMEILNSLQLTNDMTGMDAESKALLRNKAVLAVILKGTIAEYEGYSQEEIMEFIEQNSITDETEVSPGRTNTQVTGDSTEFNVLNEKVSYFDLAFRAKNPALSKGEVLISLHVDMEPQKTYRPGYPVEKRGMYYLARRLSSQLSLLTERTDYNQLEKCYSIWICQEDIPKSMQYTVSVYDMTNTKETSPRPIARENYDLMTLVVIKLGDMVYNGEEGEADYDLLRFLNAIMYKQGQEYVDTVAEYIDLSRHGDLAKEVERVTGIGERLYRNAKAEGKNEGRTEGRTEAVLELLEDYGKIPDELRQIIFSEKDLDQLRKWLKLAARSDSIEEFQKKMYE